MNRAEMINRIGESRYWDLVVIGGGASGLGVGIEGVTRGYNTLLLEGHDFAKGTSSRSTKLIHGGVRYLAQGNIRLVRSALRERGLLKKNAPHLVKDLPFIIPCYRWWEVPFYTIGLVLYDLLAGRLGIGRSVPLSRKTTLERLPAIRKEGLMGGVVYHDCQFDDARLAVNLCQGFVESGGTALNYMKVTGLLKEQDRVAGVVVHDDLSGKAYEINAKRVVNATGIFVNDILKMDQPDKRDVVVPSQGVHLVLDQSFLKGKDALMIPRTPDGRVLFAIPWHDKVVVGTTDIKKELAELEPKATEEEVEYILETAGRYFSRQPEKKDILSVFAGLRPLAAPDHGKKKTKEISRGHKVLFSDSGLITITGGKWTIYREMGEDVIDRIEKKEKLQPTKSVTAHQQVHGFSELNPEAGLSGINWYGSDVEAIEAITDESDKNREVISEKLNIRRAQVIQAVREEMAVTVEDFLARRTRALQLDAAESMRISEEVAKIMAEELKHDVVWIKAQTEAFNLLAKGYLVES